MTNSTEKFDKLFCVRILNEKRRWLPNNNVALCLLSILTLCASESATTNDGICGSQIIKYNQLDLLRLRNCRVIEGSLKIFSLMWDNETDYEDLTIPELVEITDFLLLYNIEGLKSLAHLFPNLQVIRGNNLITNYALVIYRIADLTDIGLMSLTTIGRGAVRIGRNPSLCFANTIHWPYIANGTQMEDHFIDSIKNSDECGVCPVASISGADLECPTEKGNPTKRYCWSQQHCQKICPDHCGQRSCDDKGTCCDEACLGSCDSNNTTICTVCRKLSVGPLSNRQCVETCPHDLYAYEQRRCITRDECWNISKPFTNADGVALRNPFIPFNGTCHWTCPENFTAEGPSEQRYCKPCNGECKRECQGSTIGSLSDAQNFRGCVVVTGTLTIKIRHGGRKLDNGELDASLQCFYVSENVIIGLEESLSDIEEIEGALKIIRSYPLISLNFFKKLKVIHGKNIQGNYALYVMDNQNLQSLFEHDVIIEQGTIFFHFNSKLCYATIEAIRENVHDLRYVEWAIEDVAINTNGDKVDCVVNKLAAWPSVVMHNAAVINVEAMRYVDYQVLLGYFLYYKEAPYTNVSMFDGRDACGEDGWQTEHTAAFDRKAPMVQIPLTYLKPFTQYAYYVKTFTIASEPNGGQSDILYFRTKPWQPGMVQKMKLIVNGSSSIIVNWEPPKAPNGPLEFYIVKAAIIHDDLELMQQRNYCEEPMRTVEDKPCEQQSIEVKSIREIREFSPVDWKSLAVVAEEKINFENALQNIVYVRRTSIVEKRKRRNIVSRSDTKEQILELVMVNQTNASTYTFTLDKLRHFSMYSISVQACRDFNDPTFNVNTFCSNVVTLNRRTAKNGAADNVTIVNYRKGKTANNGATEFILFWLAPKDPNGLILSYTVVCTRVDLANVRPMELCFTQKDYVDANGEIRLPPLSNGNYSISVKATSLAGDGHLSIPLYLSSGVSDGIFNFAK